MNAPFHWTDQLTLTIIDLFFAAWITKPIGVEQQPGMLEVPFMKRVALVQPPSSYLEQTNCLPSREAGVGMLSIEAFLQRAGHDVKAFHLPWARLRGMPLNEAVAQVVRFDPDIVALGLDWPSFSDGALETSWRLKRALPRALVLLGGQHASLFGRELAQKHADCFHAVLQGEAELTLQRIAESLAGRGDIDPKIPGVVLATPGGGLEVSGPEVVADLDTLPFYHAEDVWPGPPGAARRRATVSTVRGPRSRERGFCGAAAVGPQGRLRLAAHSPEWIAEHVAFLVERGVNTVAIQDQWFALGDGPLIALAGELQRRHGSARLRVLELYAEPGAYSRGALEALRPVAEMVVVRLGVTTGSPTVAGALGRETDLDAVLRSLTDARDAGVIPVSSWMVGLPEEGRREHAETRRFVAETMHEGIIPAGVSPLLLVPGTRVSRLTERCGCAARLRSFEDFRRFSRYPRAYSAEHPELITHWSPCQSVRDTLRFARGIQRVFADHWPALEARYRHSAVSYYLAYQKRVLGYRSC